MLHRLGRGSSRRHHDRHGALPLLKRLDTFGKRFQGKIGIGAHHARQGDFEAQARIARGLQLHDQIAQHAQHAGRPIRTEQLQLGFQLGQLGPRNAQNRLRTRHGDDVQVAHVLRHVARELRQIGAGIHVFGDPGEAGRHIAAPHRIHDAGHVGGRERTQQVAGTLHRHLAAAEGDQLLQGGKGIAHSAIRPVRNELEGVFLEFGFFGHADHAQPVHHLPGAQAMEVETLAAGMDGRGNLLRVGGAQHEDHVRGGLLQGLQQRVERRRGEHVHLVDDVDLLGSAGRGEVHAADDFLADVFHAGTACRVQLVDVGMLAFGDVHAALAGAIGGAGRAVLA